MGKILRYITDDGLVSITAIDGTDIVAEASRIHKTTPVMTAALGRLLLGVSIMGNMLKEKDASITVRLNGNGEGGSLIAVADSKGNPRGYAQIPGCLIMPDKNGQLDIVNAVGTEGMFSAVKDFGSGEPYVGQVPLVKGTVSEDISAYYAVSEQIPTVALLDVVFDKIWNFSRAGGVFIQLLPAADQREIVKIEENLKAQPKIADMLREGLSMEAICQKLMDGFSLELLDQEDVQYKCTCSMERVKRSLLSMGREEIANLAEEQESAEICCHFCDKKYVLSRQELLDLIK